MVKVRIINSGWMVSGYAQVFVLHSADTVILAFLSGQMSFRHQSEIRIQHCKHCSEEQH